MTTKELWREYVAFLEKNVPASFANLAPGATETTLAQLEATLGVTLPESVKDVWRLNDGQKATMLSDTDIATPCLPTLSFLSTEQVAKIWKHWGEVREKLSEAESLDLDKSQSSAVPGVIKHRYSSSKWIPLWADPSRADYVGLDFDPGEKGSVGQIINFGRNERTLYVFARDFDELLTCLLEEIRTENWKATVLFVDDEGDDDDDEDEDDEVGVPWFGPTNKNFFNTLRARWETRNPKPVADPALAAPQTPRGAVRVLQDESAALARKGELEGAFRAILEAEAIMPKDILVLRAVIDIAIKLGQFAEADSRYATLIEVGDKDLGSRDGYFMDRIKNLEEGLGDRALAIELLEARIARFPEKKYLVDKLVALRNGGQ